MPKEKLIVWVLLPRSMPLPGVHGTRIDRGRTRAPKQGLGAGERAEESETSLEIYDKNWKRGSECLLY